MRIISTLLFLLALCSPSWGAYSVVAGRCDGQVTGDGSNPFSSTAINTTGATLIVAFTSEYFNYDSALSDSKSNTWHPLTDVGGTTSSEHSRMWYAWGSISVGSGHIFILTSPSGTLYNAHICTLALSGAMTASDPIDGTDITNENGGPTIQTGSISPSVDNEIVVTGFSTYTIYTPPTINSGFTLQDTVIGDNRDSGGLAYLIQTTKTAVNPTWSFGIDQSSRTVIASFKVAVTGGGGSARRSVVVVQ